MELTLYLKYLLSLKDSHTPQEKRSQKTVVRKPKLIKKTFTKK